MFNVRKRQFTVALAASSALLGLAACGGGSDTPVIPALSAPAVDPTSSVAPAADPTPSTPAEATSGAPDAAGSLPSWAQPSTDVGKKISTIEAGDITVDVFQVGTTAATKSGQFVDPATSKPIIAKGADIVFVNYVITNSGAPVDLGSSLVNVSARYDDWKYLQGMDSVVDSALFEKQQVATDSLAQGGFNELGVYTLGEGETYSYGENFLYQKNSPITFEVTAIPVDAQGELLQDTRLEGTGTGTIA